MAAASSSGRRPAPTWKEVARAAGVSPTTASLALNDHPRVALRTRQRVAQAAARLGFVNNSAARRLARARFTSTSFEQVGLIYLAGAGIDMDPMCLAMMRGAENALSILHACLVFVRVGRAEDWEKTQRLIRAGIVDAWLVVGAVNDEVTDHLRQTERHYVVLGDHRCTHPVHSVNIDHYAVGHLAVQHLAALGHRRIGFVGGSMQYVYQHQTLNGFRAALRELALDQDERLVDDKNSVSAWLRRNRGRYPTALLSAEASTASVVLKLLRDAKIDVPRDMHLLACEAAPAPSPEPELSRIELPMDEVGRQGALLLHRVVSESSVTSSEIRVSPTLKQGRSTFPMRNQ